MKDEHAQKLIRELQERMEILRNTVALLASGCRCSVGERMSGGHLIGCPVPEIQELLEKW